MRHRRSMQPLDRALCVSAGLLGVITFVVCLTRMAVLPWALPVGIAALLVGLVAASLVTWRGRW